MTQTVPATAVLGPGKTGLTIGLRVLNLDGSTYAAFSTTGVAETSAAGTYRKAGGVVAPLAGGYIVWGTALVDYAEATVESAAANMTYWAGSAVNSLIDGNVPAALATSGTYSYSNTVDDGSGNLLDGVFVELATDSAMTNVVSTTHTNSLGAFTVYSDTAGTHYLRLQLAGYSFAIQTVTTA